MFLRSPAITALIDLALAEDVGTGDLTAEATVPSDLAGEAVVRAKAPAVLCGTDLFGAVMARVDPTLAVHALVAEGSEVGPGTPVLAVRGRVRSILVGERTALDFLGRLSGVATLTRAFVAAVAGTRARICDTRKTMPGWRALDKYAVRIGGGANHRTALDAGILIKENHIAAVGSVGAAVRAARKRASHLMRVEVEVESLRELEEALAAGADAVLLDDLGLEDMREAVRLVGGRVLLEASGGMTLARVRAVAAAGVDLISVGALTHSAPTADFSLRLESVGPGESP